MGFDFFDTIKAIITRAVFGGHGLIAIWRVVKMKNDLYYWYLSSTVFLLGFEGVFTLYIKEQDWNLFCPCVFFYLASVVPSIWIIEVDKFDSRLAEIKLQAILKANKTSCEIATAEEDSVLNMEIKIPTEIDEETWIMIIEQLVMLVLIFGRWMMPRGSLSRDELIQLLLVYIGTAADLLDFFDSFKDEKIASNKILCIIVLSIWSWSLLQFTLVLTEAKPVKGVIKKAPVPTEEKITRGYEKFKEICFNIDVWGILITIILQDAPFLIFRTILITYYKIISNMNLFFVFKGSLVITLQFYRVYIIQTEKNKEINEMREKLENGNGPETMDKKLDISKKSANNAVVQGQNRIVRKIIIKSYSVDPGQISRDKSRQKSKRSKTGRKTSSAGNLTNLQNLPKLGVIDKYFEENDLDRKNSKSESESQEIDKKSK